ncbi:hypothetical protein ABI59_07465 [Acidobacteria bacterium Mor1]|nr:hypothetical protein ABI59_07465 [Acidobacteria bacterium Mor1]
MTTPVTFVLSTCLLIAGSSAALAEEPAAPTEPPVYEDLRQRLAGGDLSVDLVELRFAYARETDESGHFVDRDPVGAIFELLDQSEWAKALEAAKAALAKRYIDPEAHLGAAVAYGQLGREEESDFHARVSRGLIQSICHETDGLDPERPCAVVVMYEEQSYMRAHGIRSHTQGLVTCGGGVPCDRIEGTTESGDEVVLYFDISVPMAKLSGALKR